MSHARTTVNVVIWHNIARANFASTKFTSLHLVSGKNPVTIIDSLPYLSLISSKTFLAKSLLRHHWCEWFATFVADHRFGIRRESGIYVISFEVQPQISLGAAPLRLSCRFAPSAPTILLFSPKDGFQPENNADSTVIAF